MKTGHGNQRMNSATNMIFKAANIAILVGSLIFLALSMTTLLIDDYGQDEYIGIYFLIFILAVIFLKSLAFFLMPNLSRILTIIVIFIIFAALILFSFYGIISIDSVVLGLFGIYLSVEALFAKSLSKRSDGVSQDSGG